MKKKLVPAEQPIVPREILEQAKRSIASDKLRPVPKCEVCSSDCAPNSTEKLCWVCRRLKISAWRDTDIQMNAQE